MPRRKFAATMLFLGSALCAAHGAASGKVSTEVLKTACDTWVNWQDEVPVANQLTQEEINRVSRQREYIERCKGLTTGISNEMIGELSWLDDTHKKVVIGNWENGVTMKQIILVFVDYVSQNPATLNKPANEIIRRAAENVGLYTYASP